MGKHEPMTPKAIANRIKSKGLQKLRWYCQMCQKQCRDENGFKCHTMSEAHQRQLLLFGENPNKFMSGFSVDFERGYLDILRRMHGTKRTLANSVYQDYIKDRDHIHMNSTAWHTLSGFVQYLGRTGKCIADHTEKGWYITYVDRDPETAARQEKLDREEKRQLDDEERMQLAFNRMRERDLEKIQAIQQLNDADAADEADNDDDGAAGELKRTSDAEKFFLELKSTSAAPAATSAATTMLPLKTTALTLNKIFKAPGEKRKHASAAASSLTILYQPDEEKIESTEADNDDGEYAADDGGGFYDGIVGGNKKPKFVPIGIKSESSSIKASSANDDRPWLVRGLIVKIITRDLGEKFYKKKALVKKVLADDKFTAIVEPIMDGADDADDDNSAVRIKIDQTHVETVIPKPGRPVVFVRGRHAGQAAEMLDIDYKKFCVQVRLLEKTNIGDQDSVVRDVPYDHVCKIAAEG